MVLRLTPTASQLGWGERSAPMRLLFALSVTACPGEPQGPPRDATRAAPPKTPLPQPTTVVSAPRDPSSAPTAPTPPPTPPGVSVSAHGLWILRCDAASKCPKLLQAQGHAHCRALEFAGRGDWRLPSRKEVASFSRVPQLAERGGYHWTATPDEHNPKMFWIVDPTTAQPTTIPATRKPFTVRCVSATP